MIFKDYQGRSIEMSDDSWKHIQDAHPEITCEHITSTLADPLEVRKSNTQPEMVELYYRLKIDPEKVRYVSVVVKKTNEGFFVSTAMTTTRIKDGELIFRKGETK